MSTNGLDVRSKPRAEEPVIVSSAPPESGSDGQQRAGGLLRRFFATGPDQPVLQDPDLIERTYRKGRVTVMFAITLGYGVSYTTRLGLSVVKKPLIDGGIFTADQLGTIGSAFLYTYAFGKLTNGVLADHANTRTFFSTGLLLSALLNFILGGSVNLLLAWVVLWGLNGWFSGFGAPASAVSLSNWFSNRERGRYYGIWSTAHAIGEGLSFYGTAALVGLLGWRAGFWGPGLLCVVSALVLYRVLLDRPQTLGLPAIADWKQDHGVAVVGEGPGKESTWRLQSVILRSPAIWVIGVSNAFMYVSRYAVNSWGILYLQEARNYSLEMAGLFMTVNTIAGIAGSVAFGYVSDKLFNARRPPANLIFGTAELAALFVIFFVPQGHPVVLAAAFAVYGFSLSGILASLGGLFAMDIAPKKAAGAAMGFSGVFGYLGAAIQDQVSGHLIHQGTTIVDGVRHYDFSTPILFWVGASALSLILAVSLWRVQAKD